MNRFKVKRNGGEGELEKQVAQLDAAYAWTLAAARKCETELVEALNVPQPQPLTQAVPQLPPQIEGSQIEGKPPARPWRTRPTQSRAVRQARETNLPTSPGGPASCERKLIEQTKQMGEMKSQLQSAKNGREIASRAFEKSNSEAEQKIAALRNSGRLAVDIASRLFENYKSESEQKIGALNVALTSERARVVALEEQGRQRTQTEEKLKANCQKELVDAQNTNTSQLLSCRAEVKALQSRQVPPLSQVPQSRPSLLVRQSQPSLLVPQSQPSLLVPQSQPSLLVPQSQPSLLVPQSRIRPSARQIGRTTIPLSTISENSQQEGFARLSSVPIPQEVPLPTATSKLPDPQQFALQLQRQSRAALEEKVIRDAQKAVAKAEQAVIQKSAAFNLLTTGTTQPGSSGVPAPAEIDLLRRSIPIKEQELKAASGRIPLIRASQSLEGAKAQLLKVQEKIRESALADPKLARVKRELDESKESLLRARENLQAVLPSSRGGRGSRAIRVGPWRSSFAQIKAK